MPTVPIEYEENPICAGVGITRARLHRELIGDVAVTTAAPGGLSVQWARGYYARFEPSLVVYAPDGTVAGVEGDDLTAEPGIHGQSVCTSTWGIETKLRVLIMSMASQPPP